MTTGTEALGPEQQGQGTRLSEQEGDLDCNTHRSKSCRGDH